MKFRELFENFGLKGIKLNTGFAEIEFEPNPEDEEAAWEMYVELITRISTQSLESGTGDEKTALNSIYSLFNTTREILKIKGRKCDGFTKIAIIVLNQKIRPFTAKWHKISIEDDFKTEANCIEFRAELNALQVELKNYTKLLASIAKVEDLTDLEED